MKLKIAILLHLMTLVMIGMPQANLVKDGDFENFALTINQGPEFLGQYALINYYDCYSWYRFPDKTQKFQVVHYLNTTKQGLDTISGYDDTFTCQDIPVEIGKAYLLEFEYLIESVGFRTLLVTFEDYVIFYQDVVIMSQTLFSTVRKAQTTVGKLCFYGIYNVFGNIASNQRGVIVDNVRMMQMRITQIIIFSVMENWQNQTLTLSSDYKVDPTKIMVFNQTIVTIGEVLSPLLSLSLGSQRNLQLVTDLNISLDLTLLTVSISIPDYTYVDENGYIVKFIIANGSDLFLDAEILLPENTTNLIYYPPVQPKNISSLQDSLTKSKQLQVLVQFFGHFLKGASAIGFFGFSAMVFRLLSFANVYILYIFLDIGHLDAPIRQSLQIMAEILFGQGLISSFSEVTLGKKIDFSLFKIKAIEKIPDDYPTKGSLLNIIHISTSIFESCFDDFIVMMLHCLMILIIWLLISKLRRHQKLKKKLSHVHSRDFLIITLIQIISVSPIWILSITVTFTFICHFGSQDFLTKINQGIFVLIPLLLVMSWVPILLIYQMKKRKIIFKKKKKMDKFKLKDRQNDKNRMEQKNKQTQSQNNRLHISKKNRKQKQKKNIETFKNQNKLRQKQQQSHKCQDKFQKKTKEKVSEPSPKQLKNYPQKILAKNKKKYIYNNLEKMESYNTLFYILFGFLIGFQNLYLFFIAITLYKIVIIFLLCKKIKLTFEYIASIISIFIKLSFHLSFLILFIMTKLIELQKIEDETICVQQLSHILSLVILYSFLSGIAVEALLIIVNLLHYIWCFINSLRTIKSDSLLREKKIQPKEITQKNQQGLKNSKIAYQLVKIQEINDKYLKMVFDVIVEQP